MIEEERRKDSNVAHEGEITRNLKSFAARRTDIFGDDEVAIGGMRIRDAKLNLGPLAALKDNCPRARVPQRR